MYIYIYIYMYMYVDTGLYDKKLQNDGFGSQWYLCAYPKVSDSTSGRGSDDNGQHSEF